MLNASRILDYVKTNLSFPWQFIEFSDPEILSSTYNSLRTFAQYFPDTYSIGMNLSLASIKVPNKANEYYITDPDGREIINVAHVYYPQGQLILFGHPPIGPMSLGELSNWAYNVEIAGWVKSFSSWNYTHTFKHPNILVIRPTPSEDWVAVEYEREHAQDYSTIPNGLQMYFLELVLADVMIKIGRIRKKYGAGGLKSPFGDINLSDEIFDEGKEKRAEVIEKLTAGSLTNVVVSWG